MQLIAQDRATLSQLARTLLSHRELLVRTSLSEIRHRYAGSILGIFWLALAPALLMGIYAGIYLLVFRIRPPDLAADHYVLYVLSGLVPFLGFSEALTSGSSSLSLNKKILLSTVFPAELVPLRAVISSQAPTAVGIVIATAVSFAMGLISPAVIAIPIIWLALVMFISGIVWMLSLVSLIAKDVPHALTFVNMILLVICPIGYTPQMVPRAIQPLIYLNPLSYYIDAFHQVLVFGQWPSWTTWAVILLLAFLSVWMGFSVFQKAKRVFFDYA